MIYEDLVTIDKNAMNQDRKMKTILQKTVKKFKRNSSDKCKNCRNKYNRRNNMNNHDDSAHKGRLSQKIKQIEHKIRSSISH